VYAEAILLPGPHVRSPAAVTVETTTRFRPRMTNDAKDIHAEADEGGTGSRVIQRPQ
jgi:hypothetical protein